MADPMLPDDISDEQKLLRNKSSNAKRARHQFAFELQDNSYPYDIQVNGVGKKIAVFNYSPEYFRRKKSNGGGLNSIAGGNIPSDMITEGTFSSPNANPDGSSPKPIVCSLNKGTGARIKSFNTLNLSPNDIQPYPCQCGINPEWTANGCDSKLADPEYVEKYGGRCVKLNPPAPGTDGKPVEVGITRAGSADCPMDNSWTFEAGKRHKPNFMYLPAHQCSCSKHPRAAGFANEDNYDCLKKNLTNSGAVNANAQAPCCDTFGNCMINKLTPFKVTQASYVTSDGEVIFYGPLRFEPDCLNDPNGGGAKTFMGFSCNMLLNPLPSKTSGFPLDAVQLKQECSSSDKCSFGFLYFFDTQSSLCPEKPELKDIPADIIAKYGNDILQYINSYPGRYSRTYLAGGNTNCDCTAKGYVTYSGSKDCRYCNYAFFPPNNPNPQPTPPGGIAPPPTFGPPPTPISIGPIIKCTEKTASPKAICGCIWNDELEVKGYGVSNKLYVSTLTNPSYRFGNGTKLEIGDSGEVRDVGCGQEVILNCNDIN